MNDITPEEMKTFLKILHKMSVYVAKQMLSETQDNPVRDKMSQAEPTANEPTTELCSTKQARMIYARTKNFPALQKEIRAKYGKTDNIPKSEVRGIINRIEALEG